MTTWIRDDRGNKCSVEYLTAARAAIAKAEGGEVAPSAHEQMERGE